MEWWMIFFFTKFSWQSFWRGSYTCSSDYSVYDGRCTYTHLSHAHFSTPSACTVTSTLLMRVTYTDGSRVPKRFFARACHFSPSHLLQSHVSPMLAVPWRSLRDHSWLWRPHVLAVLTCPKSAEHAHLRTRTSSLATWPSPPSTHVSSPTSSTRSLLWTMTRCSLTIQTSMKSLTSPKTHSRTKDCSMFSQCLTPPFRTFLMMILLFR